MISRFLLTISDRALEIMLVLSVIEILRGHHENARWFLLFGMIFDIRSKPARF